MTIATNVVLSFRDKSVTMGPRPPVVAGHEILPFGYVHTNSFGSPTVTSAGTISPAGYVNTNYFGAMATARITLNPAGFVDTDLFGAPTVTGGVPTRTLRPFGYVNPNYFGSPALLPGRTLYPAGWDDRTLRYVIVNGAYVLVGDRFGSPTLTYIDAPHRLVPTNLIQFEPFPPGIVRPGIKDFSTGNVNSVSLYNKGTSGPARIFNQEAYGYSVLDRTDPENPTALLYNSFVDDGVTLGGDGTSITFCSAVSDDGQRMVSSLGGPADAWFTVVGRISNEQWSLKGSCAPRRAASAVIQYVAGRYIAYLTTVAASYAIDITTLPVTFAKLNMTSEACTTSGSDWPGGSRLKLCGTFLTHSEGGSIRIADVSSPGSTGSITNLCPVAIVTGADIPGGRTIQSATVGLDAVSSDKLWVLVELLPLAGEMSASYALLYVTRSGMTKTVVAPVYRIPVASGQRSYAGYGENALLVSHLGRTHVVMVSFVANQWVYHTTATDAWSAINTTVPPIQTIIPEGFSYRAYHPSALSLSGYVYTFASGGSYAWVTKMVEA